MLPNSSPFTIFYPNIIKFIGVKWMKRIISLTGHKHTYKDIIAFKLMNLNDDVVFVRPYTDWEVPSYEIPEETVGDFNFVLPTTLDKMMEEEKVLSVRKIDGHRFVFFEFQLTGKYNVLIVDDYQLLDIKDNWDGELYSVFTVSQKQQKSDRVEEYLYKHNYDEIFEYGVGDFDMFERRLLE